MKNYEISFAGCGDCICKQCLNWWSARCPCGNCYDDHRAKVNPYDKAHPVEPPRDLWSNWETEQAFWCRGGICYPAYNCDHYIKYDDAKTIVKTCLYQNVVVYQDGFILCGTATTNGCEWCMQRFEEEKNESNTRSGRISI